MNSLWLHDRMYWEESLSRFLTDMSRREDIHEIVMLLVCLIMKRRSVNVNAAFVELEVLTGKYAADSSLIYDLKGQGGELRYYLTLPFAHSRP